MMSLSCPTFFLDNIQGMWEGLLKNIMKKDILKNVQAGDYINDFYLFLYNLSFKNHDITALACLSLIIGTCDKKPHCVVVKKEK